VLIKDNDDTEPDPILMLLRTTKSAEKSFGESKRRRRRRTEKKFWRNSRSGNFALLALACITEHSCLTPPAHTHALACLHFTSGSCTTLVFNNCFLHYCQCSREYLSYSLYNLPRPGAVPAPTRVSLPPLSAPPLILVD
jgi:hypothetical protein